MAKTILKWVLLTMLLAYVVWAAAWARGEAAKNTCKGIEINISSGNTTDSVTRTGIMGELSHYPKKITGTPISSLNTRDIEKYLLSLPQFEEVNCIVTTTGKLRINVVPMVPVARVFSGDKSFYINKEGKEMPSKSSFFVDVPVITGKFSDKFRPEDVLPVIRFVENDEVMERLVSMVHAESPRDIYLVPRIQGHIINFGDTMNLESKKEALLTFYRKVLPYKGWEEYDTISVKFKGQIVATRRDKTARYQPVIDDEEIDLEEATLPETDEI